MEKQYYKANSETTKTINLQRAILVDLDWLEDRINNSNIRAAYVNVLRKSIPASKVAEVIAEGISDIYHNETPTSNTPKSIMELLNSPIQIP